MIQSNRLACETSPAREVRRALKVVILTKSRKTNCVFIFNLSLF